VEVEHDAQFRVYSIRSEPLEQLDEWLGGYRALWEQRMDALHTEVARGRSAQKRSADKKRPAQQRTRRSTT
jgi:hypothetical protein